MLDKLKALIKAKQKQFEEDTYDHYVDGWYEALQWALDEIEKLEKEDK